MLFNRLKALGLTDQQAGQAAVLIGDTPHMDGEGNILVVDPKTSEIIRRVPRSVLEG